MTNLWKRINQNFGCISNHHIKHNSLTSEWMRRAFTREATKRLTIMLYTMLSPQCFTLGRIMSSIGLLANTVPKITHSSPVNFVPATGLNTYETTNFTLVHLPEYHGLFCANSCHNLNLVYFSSRFLLYNDIYI